MSIIAAYFQYTYVVANNRPLRDYMLLFVIQRGEDICSSLHMPLSPTDCGGSTDIKRWKLMQTPCHLQPKGSQYNGWVIAKFNSFLPLQLLSNQRPGKDFASAYDRQTRVASNIGNDGRWRW